MPIFLSALLVAAAGYVLGSIPFAVLVSRARGVNILEVGSGNPGATNVLRTLGKGPGYTVFLLDFFKGFVAAGFPLWMALGEAGSSGAEWLPILGLTGAILGHSFSLFLKFRGGKGVATTVGGVLAVAPVVILVAVVVWVVAFYTSRYVSLASILLGVSLPISALVLGAPRSVLIFCSLLAVLIVVRHKSNIVRILNGTESRFKGKKPPAGVEDNPTGAPPNPPKS